MSDRSKDVSCALTEVRTVHKRAISAWQRIAAGDTWDSEAGVVRPVRDMDPDYAEMLDALGRTIELLQRWERKR